MLKIYSDFSLNHIFLVHISKDLFVFGGGGRVNPKKFLGKNLLVYYIYNVVPKIGSYGWTDTVGF